MNLLIEKNWLLILASSFLLAPCVTIALKCDTKLEARFDCFPGPNPTQSTCEARGCCWNPSLQDKLNIGLPECYFAADYNGYNMTSLQGTANGYVGLLSRSTSSGWSDDIKQLQITVLFETSTRIHIKIFDPTMNRYQVPINTPPPPPTKPSSTDYDIEFFKTPFGFKVYRKSNKAVLFDSSVAPLIFADQLIQISSLLSSEYVYGLGEHKSTLLHNASSWQRLALWAKDQLPVFNSNLYGAHPFYINIESDGQMHAVFLLNSNAMEVEIQPLPALTLRTIGGILDLYIMTGSSGSEVVSQYTEVIGRPQLPAYWVLGFHLCRYNYNSAKRLREIIARNRKLQIPYEVQWNDIDYMNSWMDWTYDENAYEGLPDIVKDLHDYGQKYIIIVDPGISNQLPGKYKPYDMGLSMNAFITNASDLPFVGKVWPGSTVFPDFTNPNTTEWWFNMASQFHQVLPFDGLWTDMNEPSNFVSGSLNGCTSNNLDEPPYVPAITGNGKLYYNTVCPSAKQYLSSHYNLHNMYGLTEAIATNSALLKILGKRSVVISRSSFPSLGRHGGHWTGDVLSVWEDLYYSIPAILEFQLYGIPLVGADVCGFNGNTTEELCIRWMQLGAFYPFMRNHNDDVSIDQDPGAWSPAAQQIIKSALDVRYMLLPFMYTCFYLSHMSGVPVIQPLFFKYERDKETYSIDDEFLWGSDLLISPALKQGQIEVNTYFPADDWYDLYDGSLTSSHAQRLVLKSPLDKINVHVRGGAIIPTQQSAINTVIARKTPFSLLVALDSSATAAGLLYLDDGESLDSIERNEFSLIKFSSAPGKLKSEMVESGYMPADTQVLDTVRCLGVSTQPSQVTFNGRSLPFNYYSNTKVLFVPSIQADLMQPFTLTWQ